MGSGASKQEKQGLEQDLRGQHFIITGANTGMGYVNAREFAKMGAKVTMACRTVQRGQEAAEKLRQEALEKPVKEGVKLQEGLSGVDVVVEPLDLGSLQSIISFAQKLRTAGSKVDVLVNNAGLMAIPQRTETVDGFELHIGVNHLGHHLLTRLLEPLIVDNGRIVFLSSLGHDKPPTQPKITIDWDNLNYQKPDTYNRWQAYGRSKLGNLYDAQEFAKRLASRGITTYAVHPGGVRTDLSRTVDGGNDVLSWVGKYAMPLVNSLYLTSPLKGSLTAQRCAVDPELGRLELSGKYWADLKEATPSQLAQDPANAPRFWQATETMLEEKLGKKIDDIIQS